MSVGNRCSHFFSTIALAFWLCLGFATRAATLTVTSTADSGAGSLRNAIASASSGDTINFASSLSGQIIRLTSGELLVPNNLTVTIDASALAMPVVIDGGHAGCIFEISAAHAVLNSLVLTNGSAGSGGSGGGVVVGSSASLTLNGCTISGSFAGGVGGGLLNAGGTVTVNNCLFYADSTSNFGGGFYNSAGSTATVNNSTFLNNTAVTGGGVMNYGSITVNNCTFVGDSDFDFYDVNPGAARLINCTFADYNRNVANDPDGGSLGLTNCIAGPIIYGSYSGMNNYIGSNPQLAPLGMYGGPTLTMPPKAGSPVINAGIDSVTNFLATDQRGYPRLSGAHVDIGAVEAQIVPAANAPVLNGGSYSDKNFQFSFSNAVAADFTALTSTNLAVPLSNWTVLGNAMEVAPGQYEFTDTSATNHQQFYGVVSP